MRQRNTIAINAPLTLLLGTTRCFGDAMRHLWPAQLGGARLVIGNVFCVTGTGLSHFRTQKRPPRRCGADGRGLGLLLSGRRYPEAPLSLAIG